MINDAQLHELIGKYLAGELLEDEKQQLFTWVEASTENRAFFEEMISLWSLSEEPEPPMLEVQTDVAWANIESLINSGENNLRSKPQPRITLVTAPQKGLQVVHRSSRLVRWSIAASVAILAIALYTFWPGGDDLTLLAATNDREQTEVQLEDGSTVWLNERSELRFAWKNGERRVELTGEAFFEVARMPEQPFVILAGNTETRVLGTSFNLRAYPEEETVELDVETGLVAFSKRSAPEDILEIPAGKGATATPTILAEEKKQANAQGWRLNLLQYKDAPLAQVVEELEQQYDVELVVENQETLNCPISVRLRRDELAEDLGALLFFLGGQIEPAGDNIFRLVGTKSCKKDFD